MKLKKNKNGKYEFLTEAKTSYKIDKEDSFDDEYSFKDFFEDWIKDASQIINDLDKEIKPKKISTSLLFNEILDFFGESIVITREQQKKINRTLQNQLNKFYKTKK